MIVYDEKDLYIKNDGFCKIVCHKYYWSTWNPLQSIKAKKRRAISWLTLLTITFLFFFNCLTKFKHIDNLLITVLSTS